MKITDEAEQKVARLLFDREWRDGDWRWEDYPQPNRWQLLARQVLETALPLLQGTHHATCPTTYGESCDGYCGDRS